LALVAQVAVVLQIKAEILEATQVLILLNPQVVVEEQRLGTPTVVLVVQAVAALVLMSWHQHLAEQVIHLQFHLLKEIMEEAVPMVAVTSTQAAVAVELALLVELQQLQLLATAE
jgi:hypothetical protein